MSRIFDDAGSAIARLFREETERQTNQRERAYLRSLKFTERELTLYEHRVFGVHRRLDAWLRKPQERS